MAPAPQLDPGVHPVVRNALRVSLSAKEYKILHDYAVQRISPSLRTKLPTPARFEGIVRSKHKHNEAAVRASLRVFLASGAFLKLVDLVLGRIQRDQAGKKPPVALLRSPNFRLSLSLSLMILLHRLLYRFFVRLRANLRTDDAQPFRDRNPRISRALTSRYAPAVGASIAGLALGISPQTQLRRTVAIYAATRGLESLYNVMDEKGWLENKPWWFGSWLLMPLSCAQLFHAFVFDREATPKWLGNVILKNSPSYIHDRPDTLPAEFPWPAKTDIVDSLATIANLRWPLFVSPILHPSDPTPLPSAVKAISPITGPAHPSIVSLSCALLHPSSPSCGTAFLHHLLLSVPPLARLITGLTLALSALKFKAWLASPLSTANSLSKRIITLTAVLSAALGSGWGSLCLWNLVLPRSVVPRQRFYLSGALAGVPFAFLGHSRSVFLYFFRGAVDSAWKAGVKRGHWKRWWSGGEVWLFVVAWAILGSVLEGRPTAVQGRAVRKLLAWAKGERIYH
ncbi:hypothetical protein P175DRAFT_0558845 [Aspergillus ochraceoroseus IBT 24754]|uniref:Transmembrane protein 135 N-terminal domain-containing protein n=1 Tax=Aspergillus ochraceoroseus IBT 24754 TaxID=1392256 RepID=A0A2T5LSM1_9EURO|nr:uncharacterized protein P175DRAFT_0558845 [Aspergillus ochraceoroseus IBT 24754]PTU19279.1 hypothetical protein P175DRAFT_0558845 [Aspergillus ochraceoroseus IBT 24754]